MAYEKTLITENATVTPTNITPTMREEKIVEYKPRVPRETTPNVTATAQTVAADTGGQTTTNGEAEQPIDAGKSEDAIKLSPQMAALARKEQRFREQVAAHKQKELELENERKELAELKALKSKLAAKDFSDIEKHVPYDAYTNYLLSKTEGQTAEQQAIKELQAKVSSVETKFAETVTKQFEAAVNERRRAVGALIELPEYAAIKKAGASEAVVQHMLDTWEHDNVDLTPEQAAKEVAAELIERAKKWQGLLEEKKQETKVDDSSQDTRELPPLNPAIKTLTNNMAATG